MKIGLKAIVGQFLDSADQSSHQFRRLYNGAVWGLKTEFNLDITGEIKTVVLEVNANRTVNLPVDYVNYSKIGVMNGAGEVLTFKRNDKLSSLNSFDTQEFCSRTTNAPEIGGYNPTSTPWIWGNNNYFNYWDNGTSFQLFGLSGVPVIGEYKIDEANKIILLNPECEYGHIVLEYLSDVSEYCEPEIDVRASSAMLAYIRWYDSQDSRKKFGTNQVQYFKREFYREKRLAKMRLNPFILNEAIDAHLRSIKLTAKH